MTGIVNSTGARSGIIGTTEPVTGIANTNHLIANANVADNDFLRVDGTEIEGRTASEVLSDISALGASNPTVTLGDNATFPAGHVIQTAFFSTTTQRSIGSATFNTSDVLGDFDFTPLVATSDILLIAMTNSWVASASSYLYSDFYKDTTDVGFTETANLSGIVRGLAITGPDQGWGVLNYFFLDTCAENSLSEKTYKFSARTHTGTAATIGGLDATDDTSIMLIQEIAR